VCAALITSIHAFVEYFTHNCDRKSEGKHSLVGTCELYDFILEHFINELRRVSTVFENDDDDDESMIGCLIEALDTIIESDYENAYGDFMQEIIENKLNVSASNSHFNKLLLQKPKNIVTDILPNILKSLICLYCARRTRNVDNYLHVYNKLIDTKTVSHIFSHFTISQSLTDALRLVC
jgi:hypothetical protein